MIHFTLFNLILGLTLILGTGLGVSRLFRDRHATLENAVLRATLLVSLLFPFLLCAASVCHWRAISVPVPQAIDVLPSTHFDPEIYTPPSADLPFSPAPQFDPTPAAVSLPNGWYLAYAIWFSVAGLFLLRLAYAQYLVYRWKKGARWATAVVWKRLVGLAHRNGVTTPEVYTTPAVQGPVYCGILRPSILLPESDEEITDEVLHHELGHHIGRDNWWLFCGEVVTALFFFHPLAWMIARRQIASSEEVCDDFVLSQKADPCAYATQLADQAYLWNTAERFGLASNAMAALKSSLGRRVQRILNTKRFLHARISIGGLSAIALCALIMLGACVFLRSADQAYASPISTNAPDKPDLTYPILSIIDRNGKKLSPQDLPPGVLDYAVEKKKYEISNFLHGTHDATLVVASLVYPDNDTDLGGGAMLVSPRWTEGRGTERIAGRTLIALRLDPGDSPCSLRSLKMGDKTADIPVPTPETVSTLIWMGDVGLMPDDSPTQIVTGSLVDQEHKVLGRSGTAYLWINGTPMLSGLATAIDKGQFSFPAVRKGRYLLGAKIDGCKVQASFVDVAKGTSHLEAVAMLVPPSTEKVPQITSPADGVWLTSYDEARKASAEQKKPIFMDFTGSDWCEWCQKFDKEVLSTPAFLAYAKEHLILLRVDFPQKTQQPLELANQNKQLAEHFRTSGYPYLMMVTADEHILFTQEGYASGGPDPFIARLQKASSN